MAKYEQRRAKATSQRDQFRPQTDLQEEQPRSEAAPQEEYPEVQQTPQYAPPQTQGVIPVSPSADYRRQSRQAPMGGYVPAGHGAAGQYSRTSANYQSRGRGSSPAKTVAIVVILLALIAAVAGLGFYVYKETQKSVVNADLHKLADEEMAALDSELTGMKNFDRPFTVLLLGSDARSDDPDMGARTDTIILTRVDPTTNTVSMMSIPRDTLVQLPGVGTAKMNAAYFYGGPSGTISAVKELTGVDIDHYAEINFEGLVDLIDAIGGIDVYVEERIDDPDAGPDVIEEGWQHLDGWLALEFSRSRAYADGDYTRQRNQRKVIDAIIHKGLEAPATELTGLIQASTKFLTTDSAMDFDFIYSLADQIRHNNDYPVTIYSANIPSAPTMVGDVSYVVADTAGVAEMVRIFMEGGDISGQITASSISADIANAGGGASSTVTTPTYTYQEPVYYYEEPAATYYEQPNVVDNGGAAIYDDGGGVDYGGGADYGGGDYGGDYDGGGGDDLA